MAGRLDNTTTNSLITCDQAVDGTIKLMEDSYRVIDSYNGPTNFVLLIGNTGTGKSTQKTFLTNPKDLECCDVGDRYLIQHRDTRNKSISSESTIVSETLIPTVAVHEPTQTAYYDLPGFGDTRSECFQIVNAFSIKKVADQAQKVKLLLVVNHSSLKSGESRNDIVDFLDNATNLIQNPRKYARSIALVATKVDSRRRPKQIVDGIGEFLTKVRDDLNKVNFDDSKRAAAKYIIDALVHKTNGEYTRISIFSEPQELKPLDQIDSVKEERRNILSMLNNLVYADGSPDDFGLTLSPSAKLLLLKIADKMNENISETMGTVGAKFKTELEKRVAGSHLEDIGTLFEEQQKLTTAIKDLKPGMKRQDFLGFLQQLTKSLKLENVIGQELENFELRQRKQKFVESVVGIDLPANVIEWISPIQSSAEIFKKTISEKAAQYMEEMGVKMSRLSMTVYKRFESKLLPLESDKAKSTALHLKYTNAIDKLNLELPGVKSVNTFIRKVQSIVNSLDEEVDVTTGLIISKTDVNFGVPPFQIISWMKPFEVLEAKLGEASRLHAIKCDNKAERERQEMKIKEQNDRMEARDVAHKTELKELQEKSQSAIQEQNKKLEEISNKYEEEKRQQERNFEKREQEYQQQLKDQEAEVNKRMDEMEKKHAAERSNNSSGFTITFPTDFLKIFLPGGGIGGRFIK